MEQGILVQISILQYITAFFWLSWDVVFQKIYSWSLGSASGVCHDSVKGKTCIVTGATSGIGLETAKELLFKGAKVVLAVRNTAAAEDLIEKWKIKNPDIVARVVSLDLSSFKSVREFCASWDPNEPVDVLINNAGLFNMAGSRRILSEGYEEHLTVNFLSPALLTLLLLPQLSKAKGSRVINVNSQMHELGEICFEDLNFMSFKRKFSPTAAYSQSKLAQVMFTLSLHQRLKPSLLVDIIAVHPGEVITNVARSLSQFSQWAFRTIMPLFCFSPSEGCRASLFCATDPSVSYFAAFVRVSRGDGPYYLSNCQPVRVAPQARNPKTNDLLLDSVMGLLDLPADYLERDLTL